MPFDMLTCRLDHEEDADIIEFIKRAVAQGYSKTDVSPLLKVYKWEG